MWSERSGLRRNNWDIKVRNTSLRRVLLVMYLLQKKYIVGISVASWRCWVSRAHRTLFPVSNVGIQLEVGISRSYLSRVFLSAKSLVRFHRLQSTIESLDE